MAQRTVSRFTCDVKGCGEAIEIELVAGKEWPQRPGWAWCDIQVQKKKPVQTATGDKKTDRAVMDLCPKHAAMFVTLHGIDAGVCKVLDDPTYRCMSPFQGPHDQSGPTDT